MMVVMLKSKELVTCYILCVIHLMSCPMAQASRNNHPDASSLNSIRNDLTKYVNKSRRQFTQFGNNSDVLLSENEIGTQRDSSLPEAYRDKWINEMIVSNTKSRQQFATSRSLSKKDVRAETPLTFTLETGHYGERAIARSNGNDRNNNGYLLYESDLRKDVKTIDQPRKVDRNISWDNKSQDKLVVNESSSLVGFSASNGSFAQSESYIKNDDVHILIKRDVNLFETDTNVILTQIYSKQPSPSDVHKELLHLYKTRLNFTMNTNETMDAVSECVKLLDLMFENTTDDENAYCDSSWDKFTCWPRTLAGTTASVPCPSYLVGISNSFNATKYCHDNGTWADKAFYNMCVSSNDEGHVFPVNDEVRELSVHHSNAIRIIYNAGFTISTLALVIALFIFLYFKSLRCLRNLIHCHLIVTFILNNVIWILMRHSLIYLQEDHLSWMCRTLTTLYNFAQSTNFFWMFVEGLYLHIIFVWTYSADKIRLAYLVIIGWGLPAVNIVAWIIVRAKFENDHCWLPHPDGISAYDYIYIGPILFVLLANTIFLSTIVWVLITKLRASHTLETRQYRKAVRATVILLPLLGSTYVLFIIPPSDHPTVQIVFKYINAILQSFQGLSVAVFYCFLNGEVKSVLKKKLSRFNDARSLSTKYTRASVGWTRASEFGNSVTYGNGIVDPHRRPDYLQGQMTEIIPLTETSEEKATI